MDKRMKKLGSKVNPFTRHQIFVLIFSVIVTWKKVRSAHSNNLGASLSLHSISIRLLSACVFPANLDVLFVILLLKIDLVTDKTTDMVKRTTCLHHNCGEFNRKLNELEDDLRYLTIVMD